MPNLPKRKRAPPPGPLRLQRANGSHARAPTHVTCLHMLKTSMSINPHVYPVMLFHVCIIRVFKFRSSAV
ncbi:hypothetical protein BDZ91DRAFT_717294 [Kalaharituber pfeilii]|nr:hypothetical protein BDZ91DRAFT_717294 [Kalaharituber pfeilii]